VEVDLQRFRDSLTPAQRAAIDVDAQWRRYRAGGGFEDEAAFETWLAGQFPQLFVARVDEHVEVSRILPARFAHADARTLDIAEAPTVRAASGNAPESKPAPSDSSAQAFHYTMIGTAGAGGMGTVHIARDSELLRRVALKQLNANADANDSARTRFLREAQITAQLDHPNIVPVYALEVAPGGTPAYTMKLVEGRTFHALLNEARDFFADGKWPDENRSLAQRLEHFLKVCDAIAYAHDKGAIHRDLKPANLMLGRHNEVYVMDWGLCRILRQPDDTPPDKSVVMSTPDVSGSASETQIGDVVGTPKYMSPEQAQGRNRELDARSDQCALGLILYEMVTLNPPYEGRTAYEVLANAASGKRRPIAHAYLRRRIPRELHAVIERATAYKPENRYADVAALAADIRRYLRGEAVLAEPDRLWQRTLRAVGRNRQRVLTGIFGLTALAAIAIGGLLWQNQRLFQSERLREQRLLALSNGVSAVGDRVGTRFIQLEGAIVNLADSVAQALASEAPEQHYYMVRDLRSPATAPPDLQPSTIVKGKVSLGYPAWSIPPGMNPSAAAPAIRSLSRLQSFRRDIYARVAAMVQNKSEELYASNAPAPSNDDNPVKAIVIALSNGVESRYPGWDSLPDDYDPRVHPWFKLALGKHAPQWGDPYTSGITHTLELPLSVPVYDEKGEQSGVVSMLLMPARMVQTLLAIDGVKGVRGVYLLDADGDIIASKGHVFLRRQAAPDTEVAQPFPVPAFLQRLKSGQNGVFETDLDGQPSVLEADEIAPLGWHVVAVADPRELFKAAPAAE
jgi:serine/threonine-protein kinase